jgi:hypothetical protein
MPWEILSGKDLTIARTCNCWLPGRFARWVNKVKPGDIWKCDGVDLGTDEHGFLLTCGRRWKWTGTEWTEAYPGTP